jgi:hypothetical protein
MGEFNVSELLISIAAIFVAMTTIYNFVSNIGVFTKNKVNKATKKKVEAVLDEQLEERVDAILDEKMPKILYEHDLETREKYRNDRQNYLNEIKEEVSSDMHGEFNALEELKDYVNQLALSAKDVLREKIMAIYHKNVEHRSMTENEREALDVYYADYKAIGGNSYIDKYYRRMKRWRVDYEDYDDGYADEHDEHDDHHDDDHEHH